MREIKFRAWHTKYGMKDWDCIKGCLYQSTPFEEFETEYTLIQYTGLKDSSGREIYEGDIVKRVIHENSVIDFLDGSFWMAEISKPDLRVSIHFENSLSPVEIIGNIYENPELLKG